MSTHSSHKDPAAKVALLIALLFILATAFVLVSSLVSTITKNTTNGEIDTDTLVANNASMVEAKIKPIGEVSTHDGSGAVAAGPARSGDEVYAAVCSACHNTGAAGAPKIDDKAAWEPRVATGFDALMNTAINGKGAMPARGGQNVPDAELKAVIAYMTTKAGFNLDIPNDKAPTTEAQAPSEKADENKKEEASDEKPSDTETKVESTESIVAPAAPTTEASKTTEEPTKTEETPIAEKTAIAEQKPSISGEKIYKSTCFACHGIGVAGSPKTGDKAAWKPRVAKGKETLYTSAIKGFQSDAGMMPPKGGNFSLSDDEVKAAVDYMVSLVE